MYHDFSGARQLHPDEVNILKIMYDLPNFTDMSKYRDSVITNVTWPVKPNGTNITKPTNNAINIPINTFIGWSYDNTASNYHLQVSSDSTFQSNIVFDDSTLTDTTTSISGLANAKKYFVRIQDKNTIGTSFWSGISFTTIPPIPFAPSIVQPVNNSINQPVSLTAKWGSVPFAVNYHLQFGKDSTFASNVLDTLMVDTLKFMSNLQNNQKYFMRIMRIMLQVRVIGQIQDLLQFLQFREHLR